MSFREREESAQLEEQRRRAAVVERTAKFQDALAGQIAEKQQRRQEAAEQQRRDLQRMQEVAKASSSLASADMTAQSSKCVQEIASCTEGCQGLPGLHDLQTPGLAAQSSLQLVSLLP